MRAASWTTPAILEVLGRGRWFAGLAADFQRGLVEGGRVRVLTVGERLFSRGDDGDGLYAILDGAVRVCAVTGDGKEIVLTRVEAPLWFGEIAVFDRQARTHDCLADGDVAALHVPLQAVDALLHSAPLRWRDLGMLAASKLRLTFAMLEDAAHPLVIRLARRLLVLAEGHGARTQLASRPVVQVTQEQLASMLSVSRQSLNAALKDLEQRGLVRVSYGLVELKDGDGLRTLIGER